MVQNYRDVHKEVFVFFIGYGKTFHKVEHEKFIDILEGFSVDCTKNLYWRQTGELVSNDVRTNYIPINGRVRQGCILSPLICNVNSEVIFQEAITKQSKQALRSKGNSSITFNIQTMQLS